MRVQLAASDSTQQWPFCQFARMRFGMNGFLLITATS